MQTLLHLIFVSGRRRPPSNFNCVLKQELCGLSLTWPNHQMNWWPNHQITKWTLQSRALEVGAWVHGPPKQSLLCSWPSIGGGEHTVLDTVLILVLMYWLVEAGHCTDPDFDVLTCRSWTLHLSWFQCTDLSKLDTVLVLVSVYWLVEVGHCSGPGFDVLAWQGWTLYWSWFQCTDLSKLDTAIVLVSMHWLVEAGHCTGPGH